MENYLTVAEAAKVLRVCTRTVYDALRDGRLKAGRLPGRWLITDRALQEFVAGGRSAVSVAVVPDLMEEDSRFADMFENRERVSAAPIARGPVTPSEVVQQPSRAERRRKQQGRR